MICEGATLLVSVRARPVYCGPTVASSFLLGVTSPFRGACFHVCGLWGDSL